MKGKKMLCKSQREGQLFNGIKIQKDVKFSGTLLWLLKMFCASFCFQFHFGHSTIGSNNKIMLDFVEICRKKKIKKKTRIEVKW